MSLGCARCGDCCDPVGLTPPNEEAIWGPNSESNAEGDRSIAFAQLHWSAYQGPLRDHWTVRDYRCDRFNPVTRLCEAYEDRPPVCDRFPWYGREPGNLESAVMLPVRCSFALDVAPANRSPNARPLIPLTVKAPA